VAGNSYNPEENHMTLRNQLALAELLRGTPPLGGRASALRYAVPLSLLFCIFLVGSSQAYAAQASPPARQIDWHAMGNTPCIWSPPVVGANGAIDPAATLRVLKQNGLGCYGALIWSKLEWGTKAFDWASFRKFVAAAQPAGINVWVILIPPSEGGDSPPFNGHYVRWMQELAKLSLRYPNLRGVNIDDYVSGISKKTFTPAYTCKIYQAKQSINPKLQFAPTVYDPNRSFAEKYGSCIDGAWIWYTNLDSSSNLQSWLENTRLAVGGRFPIYSGVYAHHTSWHSAAPKPGVLRSSVQTACRYADGAIIWQMPLTPPNPLLKVARTLGTGGSSPVAGKCGTFVHKGSH